VKVKLEKLPRPGKGPPTSVLGRSSRFTTRASKSTAEALDPRKQCSNPSPRTCAGRDQPGDLQWREATPPLLQRYASLRNAVAEAAHGARRARLLDEDQLPRRSQPLLSFLALPVLGESRRSVRKSTELGRKTPTVGTVDLGESLFFFRSLPCLEGHGLYLDLKPSYGVRGRGITGNKTPFPHQVDDFF
jgi:hypothetical protein